MKLLVILLCLLSERYLVHALSPLRFNWFSSYYNRIKEKAPQLSHLTSVGMLLLLVLPLSLICFVLLFIAEHLLFGFIYFLLNLFIFYYCLGPANPFYPVRKETEEESTEALTARYFSQVNGQLFSVVFWYVLMGATAVVIYRLISLCQEQESTSKIAKQITNLLDWMPARITVLLFLLVGNFQKGIHFYSKKFMASPAKNDLFLSEGGLLAGGVNETESLQMPYAENLVEHAIIVFLVFLALFTLVALM